MGVSWPLLTPPSESLPGEERMLEELSLETTMCGVVAGSTEGGEEEQPSDEDALDGGASTEGGWLCSIEPELEGGGDTVS